jgi:hypothetical protein
MSSVRAWGLEKPVTGKARQQEAESRSEKKISGLEVGKEETRNRKIEAREVISDRGLSERTFATCRFLCCRHPERSVREAKDQPRQKPHSSSRRVGS